MSSKTHTMFGKPMATITQKVHTLPYPHSPSVMVAYPSINDWRHLYDPNELKTTKWRQEMFADFKRRHERTVIKHLDEICKRLTGRAVLAEFNGKPDHSVMILPFDFLPRNSTSWRAEVGAVTRSTDPDSEEDVTLCNLKPSADGALVCLQGAPKGAGSSVDIYFAASRATGNDGPDDALLHELVHASRKVKGIVHRIPVNGGYKNLEEFLANLITNIYKSERRQRLYDYEGAPINHGAYLDKPPLIPTARSLLEHFHRRQGTLFAALAAIGPTVAAFNPVRQLDAESRAWARYRR